MKTNSKVILIFVLFGLLQAVTDHFFKVGDPISFRTIFCLFLVYTLQFIGAFNLWFKGNPSSAFLSVIVTVGLLLVPQINMGQYKELVLRTIIYASASAIFAGYATGRNIS